MGSKHTIMRRAGLQSTRNLLRSSLVPKSHSYSTGGTVQWKDHIVVGGGPVGTSTAWFLAEREHDVLLVHDPKNAGAHEDWSRLARLSFDGPADEMECSKHAIEMLDLVEEVRSMNAGAPAVPIKPGMLFIASPGTNMAIACERGEQYGEEGYR